MKTNESNKAQHSPLPWTMDGESYSSPSGERYKSNAITAGAKIIGKLAGFSGENAALIVRAVNHADKLAEALRAWEYAGSEGGISMVDWFEVARKKTREALAAYEAAQ